MAQVDTEMKLRWTRFSVTAESSFQDVHDLESSFIDNSDTDYPFWTFRFIGAAKSKSFSKIEVFLQHQIKDMSTTIYYVS